MLVVADHKVCMSNCCCQAFKIQERFTKIQQPNLWISWGFVFNTPESRTLTTWSRSDIQRGFMSSAANPDPYFFIGSKYIYIVLPGKFWGVSTTNWLTTVVQMKNSQTHRQRISLRSDTPPRLGFFGIVCSKICFSNVLPWKILQDQCSLGGGNSNIFSFSSLFGGRFPIWLIFFSDGLKPPTSEGLHSNGELLVELVLRSSSHQDSQQKATLRDAISKRICEEVSSQAVPASSDSQ